MLEAFFFLLLTGSVTTLAHFRYQNWRRKMWQEAVRSCGVQVEEVANPPLWHLKFRGRAGALEVQIEDSQNSNFRVLVKITVPGPPGFSGVRIRGEENKPENAREIEVGDEPFDSAFYIVGPARLVHALLDAETRHLLISVKAESRMLEIVGGQLRARLPVHQVTGILPLLLEIGQRFAQPLDAGQHLAENARRDPDAGVRLRNLLLLVRELPGDPLTVETLRAACSDASPEIRLRAAQALGIEGHEVLMELAESAPEDTLKAQAVSILDQTLPFDRASAILTLALRRRWLLTARACLKGLGRSGGEAEVDILTKVLEREQGELAAVAAQALGGTGSAAAEPPLILALEHENTEVLVAAANALGQVGTAAAVLPLKEASKRNAHHELHRATRQAIATIQTRLSGASPGQLSLSAAEAGQLSLAQGEAGQLSLAADPAGQLTLPPAARQD